LAPLDKAIQSVIKRLPEHSRAIERAHRESEEFRSVCADFHVCFKSLTYWQKKESSEAVVHRDEYGELLEELTQEILGWLEASDQGLDQD
jgi:hypothetical protein